MNAKPVVIAILGDSLVQGYGLPQEEGFVVQLGEWLADHDVDAELINAGVSGDTTAGGLSRIEWTLTPDIDGLIVSLGGNDVLRGIDPLVSRANLSGILTIARDHEIPMLLIGIQAPGNYGANYKQDFEAIYPELAASFDTLLYKNFIGVLFNNPDRAATLTGYFQADRLHPNAKGVHEIVADMGPKVIKLIDTISCTGDC